MSRDFVHLHLHTEYSLIDGLIRIKPLAKRVAEIGMPAVAITDMCNLFAMIKFYKAAHAAGIKPIIGADLWVQCREQEPSKLVLVCQNLTGYRHLTRLVSRSYLEGKHRGKAVLNAAWLSGCTDGLIALSAAREGDVGRHLLNGNAEQARRSLAVWRELFPNRYYLELQRTDRPGEEDYIHASIDLAVATGTPVVASNDVRFLDAADFYAHEARVCINQGRPLADPRRPRDYSEQQYLRSTREMTELFADLPEALENSVEIARRCNLELQLGKTFLPDFPVPSGTSTDDYFEAQSRSGLGRRLQSLPNAGGPAEAGMRTQYQERLEREVEVVRQMGYAGYFLIVADFIRWARENGVPVGPGRGSGAGSLVAYALGITDLDPLAYDLLFERFLNPERVSMPDFDVDFCMEGRDRVIEYVAQRYGRDHVSQIATHGTMAAKAVVRDAGRVLGHSYGYVDRIAKLIPFEVGMTLDKAMSQEEEFRRAYEGDDDIRALVDLARALEGLARNVGKHAGGVVISPSALTDFSPLYCEQGSDAVITQFDKDDVEAVGLIKFDFLGLRTLTIIDWAVRAINEQRSGRQEDPFAIESIPLDDPLTFKLLRECKTTAVFQLESRGMKDLVKRLQPDRFEDIVALVALFRPGPLQSGMVDDFINRKHGRATVTYSHADLQPILQPTYGIILYQEQVMQIAQVLAGYTLGGADLLRRAMGKKKAEEMAKQREVFTAGAEARGVPEDTATHIFDLMEKFAGYGFNKSHSAAYAMVSYQTAWLKAHYPAAFMAAVLSADMDNTDKVVLLIEECRVLGIRVRPPCVNASEYRFAVDDSGVILYGLGAVKGVGLAAIEGMIDERCQNGPYKDLVDLCRRVDLRRVNRRVLEALIRAGAFDNTGASRAVLMANLPEIMNLADQCTRDAAVGQEDLFGLPGDACLPSADGLDAPTDPPEWDDEVRLAGEKETLGLYLTGHPICRFEAELRQIVSASLAEVSAGALGTSRSGNGYRRAKEPSVVVAGMVVGIRTRNANRGGRMAFVTLDDRSARLEFRVFPAAYEKYRDVIANDRVLVVQGSVVYDEFSESLRINAERIMDMDSARDEYAKRLTLKLDASQFGNGLVQHLADAIAPFRDGGCPIYAAYSGCQVRAQLVFDPTWSVRPEETLLRQLRELLGEDSIAVHYR